MTYKVVASIKHKDALNKDKWTEDFDLTPADLELPASFNIKDVKEKAAGHVKDVIHNFNNSLKPGEKEREFIKIESATEINDEVDDDDENDEDDDWDRELDLDDDDDHD